MKAERDKHRVFFALVPDEETASHLMALGHHLIAKNAGRLIPSHNLHMTLVFMGQVNSAQMDTLIACGQVVSDFWRQRFAVDSVPEANPTRCVRLDRLGFWPQGGILWAGCRRSPSHQRRLFADADRMGPASTSRDFPWALAADIRNTLQKADMRLQQYAPHTASHYVPHVTLARGVRCPSLPRLETSIDWAVDRFVLMESIAQGTPLRYEVRAAFSLLAET
jgi:2'-5' RNA ligase